MLTAWKHPVYYISTYILATMNFSKEIVHEKDKSSSSRFILLSSENLVVAVDLGFLGALNTKVLFKVDRLLSIFKILSTFLDLRNSFLSSPNSEYSSFERRHGYWVFLAWF